MVSNNGRRGHGGKVGQPRQGQPNSCLLGKHLSTAYLRIIDDSSFLIHYKAKDLKTLLTKVLLFLEVQPKATVLERQHWLLKTAFSRKHCPVPKEIASVQHIPQQDLILLRHLNVIIFFNCFFLSQKKLNRMHYSKQLLLCVDSLPLQRHSSGSAVKRIFWCFVIILHEPVL